MGTVYEYRGKLRLMFIDVDGRRKNRPTPLLVGQEREALELLKEMENRIARQRQVASGNGPPTVADYAAQWTARRLKNHAGAKMDAARLKHHVLPVLGQTLLSELRPFHVRDLVDSLKGTLAPRTVNNVYGVLHRMMEDAVEECLLTLNPSTLKRGTLPKKHDKDPRWRATAVFQRAEVERLISDEDTPLRRRVLMGLIFLGGLRFGEAAALRWDAWDPTLKPLGRLSIFESYDSHSSAVKSTKSERPREVPVHPVLASLLAGWRLQQGGGTGLVLPHPESGSWQRDSYAWKWWKRDLERLEIRHRRQHDARRTFISLCLADGASKDMLRWITHGVASDVMDLYTTPPWAALCAQVSCLKIERHAEAQVFQLAVGAEMESAHRMHTSENSASGGLEMLPRAGFEGACGAISGGQPEQNAAPGRAPVLLASARARMVVCKTAHNAEDDAVTTMETAIDAAQRDGPSSSAVVKALGALGEALQRKGSG